MKNNKSSSHIHSQADKDRCKPTRRRSRAQTDQPDDTLTQRSRRLDPYQRDRHNYDDYLQEEALEDEWFEQNS